MNTQTSNLNKEHLKKWYKETKKWAKEFDFYIDELRELKRRVNSKKVKDHIEVQVQKNIALITNTTQDRLMKNLSDNLEKHRVHLSQLLATGNTVELQIYREENKSLIQEIRRVKRKIKSLKKRISDFLSSDSQMQRHGFSY
ncbi:hypothetical protein UMM65_10625 [Aureibaculum sp. 2210JD6-5]|uniref:hypothetical protein n=1 Tax=Aureibaculum sp. 2210JD6-5 TaxID=3103957 RepID=UPI002AAE06B6|nr:hypothetical protein [Aureibaculum sp. 2210JD6-5]MDY7395698.1 hypothetical protein [Aureibaculum sp. 2210JD6-5]